MKRLRLLAVMGFLAACSAAPAPAPTPADTPTPIASVMTEKQVASVIAGFEPDARSTIGGAGECRLLYVTGEGAIEEAQLLACYLDELSLGLNSKSTAAELRGLNPPASMRSLVNETISALDNVASIDLEGACGSMTKPSDTPACSAAMGERSASYRTVESVLDRWAPYI